MSALRRNREMMQELGNRRYLEFRDQELRERIVRDAPHTIRAQGFAGVTLPLVADGFGVTVKRLRNIFADTEELLYAILRKYLISMQEDFGKIHWSRPDRQERYRAIYHAWAHHGPDNHLSLLHSILLRETRMLPDDLQESIGTLWTETIRMIVPEEHRRGIVMALLDSPFTSIADVESTIADRFSAIQPPLVTWQDLQSSLPPPPAAERPERPAAERPEQPAAEPAETERPPPPTVIPAPGPASATAALHNALDALRQDAEIQIDVMNEALDELAQDIALDAAAAAEALNEAEAALLAPPPPATDARAAKLPRRKAPPRPLPDPLHFLLAPDAPPPGRHLPFPSPPRAKPQARAGP